MGDEVTRTKYNNTKCTLDGYKFDSMKERDYYAGYLKPLLMAKEIADLEVHPRYEIKVGLQKICMVELDFAFRDLKRCFRRYIDVKGVYLPISKLKHKLLHATQGIEVEIVR